MGFRGAILQWLGSYLKGRTQSVLFNGQSSLGQWYAACPRDPCLGHCSSLSIQRTLANYFSNTVLVTTVMKTDTNSTHRPFIPSESAVLKAKIIRCIVSISECMACNRLMLNPSMSEFMLSASSRRIHLIDISPFALPDVPVGVSTSVRHLGAYFDECMSMEEHVNRLVRSCFYQL